MEKEKARLPKRKSVPAQKRELPLKELRAETDVLSSLTFSEYFNKSELQDRTIDTSLDVTVFAREIAPCLHITKRFAGEEPFDSVTRQYNDSMRRILPEYGIEFTVFPRKSDAPGEGAAISASRVRELLERGDFDAIKLLVPESTFRYLKGL